MTDREEDIQKEIDRLQQKIKDLDRSKGVQIRPLREIQDAEKCAAFDVIYECAAAQFERLKEHGYGDDDDRYYMWEIATGAVLGKDIFEKRRKLHS